jgi:integrase
MQAKPSEKKRKPTGIEVRHSRTCRSRDGARCNCSPGYRAVVYDRRRHTKIAKTFGSLSEAKGWRSDAISDIRRGKSAGPSKLTLLQAAEAWVGGATADPPTVLNRSGQPYKPSALREYRRNLDNYVLDDLGALRLSDVTRADLQALVDRLLGRGLSSSKVKNVILPVRVIFRHALERDQVGTNPTANLRMPNGHGRRDRAASAAEAAELIAALPLEDRALWATAFYGGLRRGELRGLRWEDVDLAAGIITVRRGWDDEEGEIAPKSRKGERTVPIVALLRDHLDEAKARTRRGGGDFVFGLQAGRPFTPSYIRKRAAAAWAAENEKRAKKELALLQPIGLHECRHTFVSLLHDAGLSLERIGDYVGHSSSYMTDRYRHLLAGHEQETARLFDEYLARADTKGRVEQLGNG